MELPDFLKSADPCPSCRKQMGHTKTPQGDLYGCLKCGGVWLPNEVASRAFEAGDPELLELAYALLLQRETQSVHRMDHGRSCPTCEQALRQGRVRSRDQKASVEIDLCADHGMWFDPGELQVWLSAYQRRNPTAVELVSYPCEHCGALLSVKPLCTSAECSRCQQTTQVSQPELRQHRVVHLDAQQMAQTVEAEWRRLVDAPDFNDSQHYTAMAMVLPPIFAVAIGVVAHKAGVSGQVVGGVAFVLLVGAAIAFRRAQRRSELAERHARMDELLKEAGIAHRGQCPNCGGDVEVPPHTATFQCGYCQEQLLACGGLLTSWTNDLAVLRAQLERVVRAILKERSTTAKGREWVYVGLAFTVLAVCYVVLSL